MTVPYLILAAILFLTELLYFRIADRHSIIDKPNERSSHKRPVVRGGGIIFIVALILWFAYEGMQWPWFIAGATAAGLISFADDVSSQSAGKRFAIHFVAVLLMLYQASVFDWSWWLVLVVLIICIGALNAFNFMDGINGITGIYALVTLFSFAYIDRYVHPFTEESLVIAIGIAVLLFLFFNFRRRARCFAGDVGSVTIAFVLIFMLLQLIQASGNFWWVMIFWVYGVDSVVTIIYRLKSRENIFKPHRKHLYQYLCNEFAWPHRTVSVLYGAVQLGINAVLIYSLSNNNIVLPAAIGATTLVVYLIARETLLRKYKVRIGKYKVRGTKYE
jgi:UDP-N-acetylmuramyl pentapeptide phosphotransferase/UDP-N-acetylglucosamine-1-phosphate transferase